MVSNSMEPRPPLPPRLRNVVQPANFSGVSVAGAARNGDRMGRSSDCASAITASPPPSRPHRTVTSSFSNDFIPPLPPRLYGSLPDSKDLISLNTSSKPSFSELNLPAGAERPPPLPPRVTPHPLDTVVLPALNRAADVLVSNSASPRVPSADNLIGFDSSSTFKPDPIKCVLDIFDPLASISSCPPPEAHTAPAGVAARSGLTHSGLDSARAATRIDEQTSYYECPDPFSYMYDKTKSVSEGAVCHSGRVAEENCSSNVVPPPLPPRLHPADLVAPEKTRLGLCSSSERLEEHKRRQLIRREEVHEQFAAGDGIIRVCRTPHLAYDEDITSFRDMVAALRASYRAEDRQSNVGLVISLTVDIARAPPSLSVVLCVFEQSDTHSISFSCDVSCSVEHVVLQSLANLGHSFSIHNPSGVPTSMMEAREYMLRVRGSCEYLQSDRCLYDYYHVQRCVEMDEHVQLVLVPLFLVHRSLARTKEDDLRDRDIDLKDLLFVSCAHPVTFSQLSILLECVERECEALRRSVAEDAWAARTDEVTQSVKAVCVLLGSLQTLPLIEALKSLSSACSDVVDGARNMAEKKEELCTGVRRAISYLLDSLRSLLKMYSRVVLSDFSLIENCPQTHVERSVTELSDCLLVCVSTVQRVPPAASSSASSDTLFVVAAQLFHGSSAISGQVFSRSSRPSTGMFPWIVFLEWLEFDAVAMSSLPREARLVFTVYELSVQQEEDARAEGPVQYYQLGWTSLQLFSFSGVLVEGGYMLPLWHPDALKELGPAPLPETHPDATSCAVLHVDFPTQIAPVRFPAVDSSSVAIIRQNFSLLDEHTRQSLQQTIERDIFTPVTSECRELVWDRRFYLMHEPAALPRVLLSAHSWEHANLAELHAMVANWIPLPPLDAIQLLLPCFADVFVRGQAVEWLSVVSSDELITCLPQLVEALKHETWDTSSLSRLLLARCLLSVRFTVTLYWLLQQRLAEVGEARPREARYRRRLTGLQRALHATCGHQVQALLFSQEVLVKGLLSACQAVKACREAGLRQRALVSALESVHCSLQHTATVLPLAAGALVSGVDLPRCLYFPSNSLPLLVFLSCDRGSGGGGGGGEWRVPVIYKVGDDLRQDVLTVQMLRLMRRLWLHRGLDLRIITFSCVATGHRSGMIEVVQDAETLCSIQKKHGIAGAFKEMSIYKWLTENNPSPAAFERALNNFTASCAGYCVATYVLGVCDRHNDNIMLKTSGHLFHIDFGKFLGDAQRFGAFKRDRVPFVFTPEMAYVINGGEKTSPRFQHFVDLCCTGFNIIRRNTNSFIGLFGLMTDSGIQGVSREAVDYIKHALLPGLSEPEACVTFTRLIHQSLSSRFTSVNFFLHSLAQMRFSDDHSHSQPLSFAPKSYSEEDDGRILEIHTHGYQKRYEPDKCYFYILRVEREGAQSSSYIFRTYKQFLELNDKLEGAFPLVDFVSLPKGGIMGRSHIKQVAEARIRSIGAFLHGLWRLADEVRHSSVVYTFMHPLLSDQHQADIYSPKLKDSDCPPGGPQLLHGQLLLCFRYQKDALSVFVQHAKGLSLPDVAEPNSYVKLYLLPDPNKYTKRKTNLVRKNSHPTFMEMIVYRMPLTSVEHRLLQVSVWHQDHLQENSFLGGVSINLADYDLTRENKQWFPLT